MRKLALVAILAVLIAGFTGTASAAGGSCDDAIAALSGVTSGDMAGADSRWFRFTATRSGYTPVNTSLPGTTFETTVAVYASCGGGQMAYDQGTFPDRKANVRIDAVAGQTYYVQIGQLASGGGSFELGIDAAPLGPCGPGAGDCFDANGTPGCDDFCAALPCPGCCSLICGLDSFCCSVTWDTVCEGAAKANCTVIPVELQDFEVDR